MTFSPDNPAKPADWIQLAELLRPQGRRGELLAERLTDLDDLFTDGREVWLSKSDVPAADAAPVTLDEHWSPTGKNAGRIVLKLSTSNSISDAETLAHLKVLIPASTVPDLDEDTYFVRDLVGCTLYDGDTPVGEIIDLQFAVGPDGRTRLPDAAPILVVQPANTTEESNEIMVPFIRAWIITVDTASRRLVMQLPYGLISESDTAA